MAEANKVEVLEKEWSAQNNHLSYVQWLEGGMAQSPRARSPTPAIGPHNYERVVYSRALGGKRRHGGFVEDELSRRITHIIKMFPHSKLGQDGLGGVRIFPAVEPASEEIACGAAPTNYEMLCVERYHRIQELERAVNALVILLRAKCSDAQWAELEIKFDVMIEPLPPEEALRREFEAVASQKYGFIIGRLKNGLYQRTDTNDVWEMVKEFCWSAAVGEGAGNENSRPNSSPHRGSVGFHTCKSHRR